MKSFYEMMRILENTEQERKTLKNEGKVFGEDEDDPYSVEVNILDPEWYNTSQRWEVEGSFYANNRLQDGTEPVISKPKFYVAGQTKDQWGKPHERTGTEFMNPGKNLENLPEPLMSQAIDWLDKEVDRQLDREAWERSGRQTYHPWVGMTRRGNTYG